jgi:hypothetical protein
MKRIVVMLGATLALMLAFGLATAGAQTPPDFSGTWKFNQTKSTPGIAGNTPNIAFPSQIVVKQTATDLNVQSTSVRQAPVAAIYKLDGSKVTVDAPRGITETGEAKVEGGTVVITSRRSFSSPAGDQVVNFKEVWTVDGNTLTIVKTRVEDGESSTEKAVYDKS